MENKCHNWFQQCKELNREKWKEFLKGTLKEQLNNEGETMEQFFTKEVVEEIKKSQDKLLNVIMRDFPEMKRQEEKTMKATYNGMTGELIKLERQRPVEIHIPGYHTHGVNVHPYAVQFDPDWRKPDERDIYDLIIYSPEQKATVYFENVNLADVKFSGGEVSFNV